MEEIDGTGIFECVESHSISNFSRGGVISSNLFIAYLSEMKRMLLTIGIIASCLLTSWAQEMDTAIHVKSIYFGGGSYYIDHLQIEELFEWLDSFPKIEQYEVIIQSHTDNIGSIDFNRRLSEARSQSVYSLLMDYPVVPEAIEVKDFGEFLPTYRNDSYHGRLANRRADVILKPVSL
ncbi:MAG: OmpA family protein [Saprospiraceae bacterium]|nr:OmpA family protein [Saprospiraceae bacterium]